MTSRIVVGTGAAEDRLVWLSEQLDADGSVTIDAAARELGVSEMTIRRDLAALEARGTARRVRGGARAVGPQPFAERRDRAARAKAAIAAKLVEHVPAAGAVAFDASSTITRALAGALDGAWDLTVLTNGPDTFAALQGPAWSQRPPDRRSTRVPDRQPGRPPRLPGRLPAGVRHLLRPAAAFDAAFPAPWRRRSRRPR